MSAPLTWDEIDAVHPDELTIASVPERLAALGDPWVGMNERPQSLEPLLALHERDRAEGLHGCTVAARLPEAAGRAAAGRSQSSPQAGSVTAYRGMTIGGAE